MELVRKAVAMLVVGAALLAAGCGGEADNQVAGGRSPSAAQAFPVTITHKFGTTEIPRAPERIVSVGYNDNDFALAFGQVPVGVRGPLADYPFMQRPWAQEALGGAEVPDVGAEELDFEQVAALRPDLILGVYSGMTEREYSTLSQIAPTVAQSDEFVDFGVPWQQQTVLTGRALGQEERGREIVAEVEALFAQARRDHPEFQDARLVVGAPSENGYFANASEDLRVRFFTDLGFETSAEIDERAGDAFFVDLSAERVELLDSDVLVMFASPQELADDELFQRLDAVREGRVVYLPEGDSALYGALAIYNSPLSLPLQLEGLVPRLAAAVDGDPATEVAPVE